MKSLAGLLLILLSSITLGTGSARVYAQAMYSQVSVMVEVSPEQAWKRLSDFSVAHNYVPNLTRTEIVSAQTSGLGAHRRVYDADGDYLEETIIDWQEGSGFVIKLHQGDGPMTPFERSEFSYRLIPGEESGTRVVLRMTIEMPWGIAGEKLGEWFIVPLLDDNLVLVAAGLKHYYETGQPASDDDRERMVGAVSVDPGPTLNLE